MQGTGRRNSGWLSGTLRCAVSIVAATALVLPAASPAFAAERVVPVIDGFGPYKLGMTLEQAKAADTGAKPGACGEIAEDRQCLVLTAEVFQEPATLFAVLDPAGARVERVVARLDPQRTRRRAYRCVRLSEKVFALLVVVYGSRYKQSYDQNRKPLPAVAWDGEESGRLIFEAKCRTHDEGNPLIRVVERYPNGVKPPPTATKETGPASKPAGRTAAAPRDDLPPAPPRVPVGVVEESALGPLPSEDGGRLARLARELELAKGKAQASEKPGRRDLPPPVVPPLETRDAASVLPTAPGSGTAASDRTPAETAAGAVAAAEPAAPPVPDDRADGRYTVPLDIVPPPAEAAATAPAVVAVGEAPKPPAETGPDAKPAGVVDPGPVRIPQSREPAAVPPVEQAAARQPVRTQEAESSAVPPAPPPAADTVAKAPVRTARRPALEDAPPAVPGPAGSAAGQNPQPSSEDRRAPTQAVARRTVTAAAPPPRVRPPSYGEAYAPREPTDLEAPEPFAMPEEEDMFRRQRDGAATVVAVARSETEIDAEVRRRLRAARSGREAVLNTAAVPVRAETAAASPPVTDGASREAEPASAPAAGSVRPPSTEDRRAPAAGSVLSAAASAKAGRPPSSNDRRAPVALLSVARETNAAARPSPEDTPRTPVSVPAPAEQEPARAAQIPSSENRGGRNVTEPAAPANAGEDTASAASPVVHGWIDAMSSGFSPVMTGGWRHKAPVPPARPWRERATDSAGLGTDA